MSSVSAFDPSSWTEPDDQVEYDRAHDSMQQQDGFPERDRAALDAELADLRELERSTKAQYDKARVTVDAAEAELSRLAFRIEAVQRDIEQSHTDEQGEG